MNNNYLINDSYFTDILEGFTIGIFVVKFPDVGTILQNGTYIWKLNYKDTNGKTLQNIGKVTIIY